MQDAHLKCRGCWCGCWNKIEEMAPVSELQGVPLQTHARFHNYNRLVAIHTQMQT
jgi:hypothetical protein